MSLYYHVANKEAILDGVVDLVFREIEQVVGGFEVARGGCRVEGRPARTHPRGAHA